jgi:hypothetical protein
VWVALAAFLVVRATRRPDEKGVILDHLEFGRRLLHDENVYGPWKSDPDAPVRPLHAPYPPSFGLLTAPFALVADTFGLGAARASWALLQVGCLCAAALALRRLTAPRAPPHARPAHWHWLWLLGFLLVGRFLLRDLHGGGGNSINLALCVLAFDAAERQRPARAGLWLGLSLATKPTQVWLLPVLLLLGRGRAAAWTVLVGAVAVFATLLLQRFDLAPWYRWIEGSFAIATQSDAFAAPALEFPRFEWMNQSLRCGVARWLGTVPDEFVAKVTWGFVPGLGLPAAAVTWITRGLSLGALALVLGAAWRARRVPAARVWAFAAAMALSVLLSPLSWKAHYMALLPVLFLLVQRAVDRTHRARRTAIWLLVGFAVCCLPGKEIVGNAGDEWLNSLYVVTAWGAVLMVVAVVAARSAAQEDHDVSRSTASSERLG